LNLFFRTCNLLLPGLGFAFQGKLLNSILSLCLLWFTVLILSSLSLPATLNGLFISLAVIALVHVIIAFKTKNHSVNYKRAIICSIIYLLILSSSLFINIRYSAALFGYRFYFIPSESMQPNLMPGDIVLVESLNIDDEIQINDVIVFTDKLNTQRYLIKRVSDKPVKYKDSEAVQYYVLGDNQKHSFDSRNFGLIDKEKVQGKALWILVNNQSINRILTVIANEQALFYL
jgi:signal peptidase I